jgi:hypothetical protein
LPVFAPALLAMCASTGYRLIWTLLRARFVRQ